MVRFKKIKIDYEIFFEDVEAEVGWLLLKSRFQAFSVITSHVKNLCRGWVFWPTKGTGGLPFLIIYIFDGKQHPKKFGSVDVKITNDFCS